MQEIDAAERRLSLRFPLALREWFEKFGARADVWSLQDQFHAPGALRVDDDRLILCTENQGCCRWGIRVELLASHDPPVEVSDLGDGATWCQEFDSTSEFALWLAALNVKWSDVVPHRGDDQVSDAAFEMIARTYPRFMFPDSRWPASPTRLYGTPEIVLETDGDTWLWVSALSEAVFDELCERLRGAGDVFERALE